MGEGSIELRVQLLPPQLPVAWARFPNQSQRSAVTDGVADGVARLQIAFEASHSRIVGGQLTTKRPRRIVVFQLDRGSCEAEERCLFQHEAHRVAKVSFLSSVRFINQHDYIPAIHLEITGLELLHNRYDDAPVALPQL